MGLLRFRERSPNDRTPFKKNEFHVGDREARSPIRRHSPNDSRNATGRFATEAQRNSFLDHMRRGLRPHLPIMEPDPNQLSSSESLSRMMRNEDQRDRSAPTTTPFGGVAVVVHRSELDHMRRSPQSSRFRPLGLRRRESGLLPRRTLSQLTAHEPPHAIPDGEERTDSILHFDFAPAYRYSRNTIRADGTPVDTARTLAESRTPRGRRYADELFDYGLTVDGTRSPNPAARTPTLTVDPTSGLGDRLRSWSPHTEPEYETMPDFVTGEEEQDDNSVADEENWTSLLITIPPDEQLPSASSSFVSSHSNRNSSQSHNASPQTTDITVPSTRANSANSARNGPTNAPPYICPDPPSHHPRPHPTTGALHPRRRRQSPSDHQITRPDSLSRPRSRSPIPSGTMSRTPILHHYPRRSDLTRRYNNLFRSGPSQHGSSSSSVANISRLERSVEATNARRERYLASSAAHGQLEAPADRTPSEPTAASAIMDDLDEIRERIVPSAYNSLVNARDARDGFEDHLNRFEHLDGILTRMERQEHVPDEMWVQAGLTPGLGGRVGMANGSAGGRGAERL